MLQFEIFLQFSKERDPGARFLIWIGDSHFLEIEFFRSCFQSADFPRLTGSKASSDSFRANDRVNDGLDNVLVTFDEFERFGGSSPLSEQQRV